MDPACFTTAQRLSCKMMNPDLFKPSPAVQPPAKPNRSKSEHVKTEIAQVVVDAKTGRSYCKGKLLGKVPLFIYIYLRVESVLNKWCVSRFLMYVSRAGFVRCTRTTGPAIRRPVCVSRTYLLVVPSNPSNFLQRQSLQFWIWLDFSMIRCQEKMNDDWVNASMEMMLHCSRSLIRFPSLVYKTKLFF